MTDFTTILRNSVVAYSLSGVTQPNGFINISGDELLTKLQSPMNGEKDGTHFLRCSLATDALGNCLSGSDTNSSSLSNLLIIDCDKRIDINGEILEGAPDPNKVSQALRAKYIGHILYGSFSHYTGNIGNRFRIIITTEKAYCKEELAPTLEEAISIINSNLDGELLCNAKENCTWSQPWYTPRKPTGSLVETLYIEYIEGNSINIAEKSISTPPKQKEQKNEKSSIEAISPIAAFNEQYPLKNLLNQYGYKKVYATKEYEKWLSPQSKSGIAGITVSENKFFSHHNDEFNDGYWHDAFDLMRAHENLTEKEAVKKAAQSARAPDGRSLDEYNKTISRKKSADLTNAIHTEILNQLLKKVIPINFREEAKIPEDKKISNLYFHVIVVEKLLKLAKENKWGICRNHDFIYLYNGSFWNPLDEDELKSFLGKAAETMGVEEYTARHFSFKDNLLKQFITSAHLPKPTQPKETVYVNLKNGTFVIMPTGNELRPFSPDDFLTYQLPFEYDPNAKAPLFEKYLNKVLPERGLQDILAEYLGYVFVRSSTLKLEKTLLLYGTGANGKSVSYEITRSLFGAQSVSEYSLQALTDEKGYQRAMIANKLVNYASEISGRLVAFIFKQLVSGEPVEARLPYGNPFIMSDYAKLIFNCNELPKDVEQTDAYFRRFLIVPFNVTIPEEEQDKQLAKKIIENELSGIFNWVLDGLQRLLKQKNFTESEAVTNARKQYEKESDSVKLFLEEGSYKPDATRYILLKSLYQQYRSFCLEDGFLPVNSTNFKKRLEAQRIVIMKKNTGKAVFVAKAQEADASAYSEASGR